MNLCRYSNPRYRTSVKAKVKYEARRNRRAQERKLLPTAVDVSEDVVFPTKNQHVSDIWNWD